MSTSLSVFEKRMYDMIDDLLNFCADFCSEKHFVSVPDLRENVFYRDCEYCLIKTLLDSVDAPTYSLLTRDGRYLEYVVLGEHVAEVSNEFIQFISLDNVAEYLRDLAEFNVIDSDSVDELLSWLSAFLKQ
ncbi:MAG: hypothetical protein ACP5KB_03905 [Thermoprotei archaeon]